MKHSKTGQHLCQALLTVIAALTILPAQAELVPGYSDDVRYAFDPRELALLPRYCLYTQLFAQNTQRSSHPEESKRWALAMGAGFNHMHHYCWGLMYTNRALLLVRDQRTRALYLGNSIAEFDYAINRVPADFKLLPEMLTKKGENLIRLDRSAQGLFELERAIALKADYWPSYAAISDYYRSAGESAKARKWLEDGLSASPNTQALMRRLAELDAEQSTHGSESSAKR
jgi:tetratricopeptide (TPR) repeat protein